MKTETDPVSEMLCFLKKNIKPWTKSKNIIFSSASVHLCQNPLNEMAIPNTSVSSNERWTKAGLFFMVVT
jgi:hypothetical protein